MILVKCLFVVSAPSLWLLPWANHLPCSGQMGCSVAFGVLKSSESRSQRCRPESSLEVWFRELGWMVATQTWRPEIGLSVPKWKACASVTRVCGDRRAGSWSSLTNQPSWIDEQQLNKRPCLSTVGRGQSLWDGWQSKGPSIKLNGLSLISGTHMKFDLWKDQLL